MSTHPNHAPHIPVSDCVIGSVYKLQARNLACGVWNGKKFIGWQYMMGSEFLDTEIHWDSDPNYGTAKPRAVLGSVHPQIELLPTLEGFDELGNRQLKSNEPLKAAMLVFERRLKDERAQ